MTLSATREQRDEGNERAEDAMIEAAWVGLPINCSLTNNIGDGPFSRLKLMRPVMNFLGIVSDVMRDC